MVVYRVRGSVSASGGHEPENYLREIMTEWGLISGIDFNKNDVIIGEQVEEVKAKTRAYDFVLPYKVEGWNQTLFIQSQFYAGDSGSVSHKNVDQIKTSRLHVKANVDNPIFLEYVDGAGYYGSLNGDLKKILQMPDTEDFFQVKTSSVKLRYHLQKIGFVVPIELFQAIIKGNQSIDSCIDELIIHGYTDKEVKRSIKTCINQGILLLNNDIITIPIHFIQIAKRYLLLDLIVNNSYEKLPKDKGCFLIPGRGNNIGINHSELSELIHEQSKLKIIWTDPSSILNDLQSLIDRGYILIK